MENNTARIGKAVTRINPLDVLTLAETYGAEARERIDDRTWAVDAAAGSARRAAHWALTFMQIDDSYEASYR